jgi:hypothetical protein
MLILEEFLPPESIGISELAIRSNAGSPVIVSALQGHRLLVEGLGGITLTGFDSGTHFSIFPSTRTPVLKKSQLLLTLVQQQKYPRFLNG